MASIVAAAPPAASAAPPVIDVDADDAPAAAPAAKRARGESKSADAVSSIATVRGWTGSAAIYGLHTGVKQLQVDAAKRVLAAEGKIICQRCSGKFNAHKTTFANHLKSNEHTTRDAAYPKYAFNDAVLLAFAPAAGQAVKKQRLRCLASADLLAGGVGFHAQEELFSRDAPTLKALVRLGSEGLGSDTTIASNVEEAITMIDDELLKPLLRDLVAAKVRLQRRVRRGGLGSVRQGRVGGAAVRDSCMLLTTTIGRSYVRERRDCPRYLRESINLHACTP